MPTERSIWRSKAGQDAAQADFDERVHAFLNQFAHGFFPAHWHRDHQPNQSVARFVAAGFGVGVDVGDERKFERGEFGLAQIFLELFLSGHHQRTQWNGADTGNITARFAPSCDAISTERFTAAALPEITVCSGESQIRRESRLCPQCGALAGIVLSPLHGDKPMIAAIGAFAGGNRFLHVLAALVDNFHRVGKISSEPAATSAEYSPRLWPATKSRSDSLLSKRTR